MSTFSFSISYTHITSKTQTPPLLPLTVLIATQTLPLTILLAAQIPPLTSSKQTYLISTHIVQNLFWLQTNHNHHLRHLQQNQFLHHCMHHYKLERLYLYHNHEIHSLLISIQSVLFLSLIPPLQTWIRSCKCLLINVWLLKVFN